MNISSLGKSACILLLSCFSLKATAATLNVDGGGNLLGAFGVDVGGSLYDVEFVDGTCIDLFAGCDEQSDFVFQNEQDATTAAEALLSQVFINSIDGQFDDLPDLARGCQSNDSCNMITPYGIYRDDFGVDRARTVEAGNFYRPRTDPDRVRVTSIRLTLDTGSEPLYAYAIWQPSPIPAPAALVLFASALAGMTGVRLTRKNKTA